MDKDLQSIQEVRELISSAKRAAQQLADFSQEQLDAIVKAVALACEKQAVALAKMAAEETGFGNWQDKTLKNLLGSKITYDYIKDMRTRGIISENRASGIIEVAVPMGIVAALIPSTNPTSTVMYKALISLKSGNCIIFSPHPNAKRCIAETVKIVSQAAAEAGAPQGAVGCIGLTTTEATDALLRSKDIGIILATGGEAMVRAAYSSGNPAIGVGPGNGPAYIEKTADIGLAVQRIIDSKTFDNGTICASEQSIVTETGIQSQVIAELERQGGYFLSEADSAKLAAFILRDNGTINPVIVGKTAQKVAEIAGISIPQGTKVILSKQTEVSGKNPYSREKLCPILAFYVEADWHAACERCIQILNVEGIGHTMTIHTKDDNLVKAFALKKPVSRLLVNTSGALGGVGATTNLAPALTLGCGAVGGSATSDNITPLNLINIRRVAYGVREVAEVRAKAPVQTETDIRTSILHSSGMPQATGMAQAADIQKTASAMQYGEAAFTAEDIQSITKAVIARLGLKP